ncbi:MAG TPA: hypothetical protein PKI03_01650 [Pseudomonadota bacterium]|nr:hypothetical protein [Pseudomonadota bacterium]
MRKLAQFAAIVAVLVPLMGCGGPDNVKACNDFKEKAKCGSASASLDSFDCNSYKNTACDISEYFNCLGQYYVCVNGSYDSAKLSMVTSCASKAVCK